MLALFLAARIGIALFGAGENMAAMDAAGSPFPALITSAIAVVLFVWGLYAFSGAGLIRRFPFLIPALVLITAVYLGRGLIIIPAYVFAPDQIDAFAIWSSLICLGYGVCYAIGTRKLAARP